MKYICLNDICDVRDGTHDSPKYVQDGYPLVTSKNIVDGKLDLSVVSLISQEDYEKINKRSKVDLGDIIMPMIGTIGNPWLVDIAPEFAIKNVALIKFPDTSISNRFVWYFLKSPAFFRYVSEKNKGGTQKFLSLGDIRSLNIPYEPYKKQLDIVKKLDAVFDIISLRQKEIMKLDELIKARFVEMFGNPEFNEKGWNTCRLGDECRVINGRAYKAEELLDEGKYRVLRVGNFFTNDSWYFSDLELEDDKYCDEGDLLFAWSASFGPRIWHGDKVIYHYHIWKLADYEHCLNKDFFVELLNYNCEVMKRGTHGSTMLHFTKSQMEDQQLILPPKELQNQFAEFCKQLDKSKVAVQAALDKAQLLFDSLMQEYFG